MLRCFVALRLVAALDGNARAKTARSKRMVFITNLYSKRDRWPFECWQQARKLSARYDILLRHSTAMRSPSHSRAAQGASCESLEKTLRHSTRMDRVGNLHPPIRILRNNAGV